MSTPTRLALFAGTLVVVFALAFGVGRVVPTLADESPEHSHGQPSPEVNHEH
ncbi:hypothetical protein [Nocardioides yefusunii]|uniref:DUF2613 family protein n=1 Tax=Nocardioides yefusunii TaxID=2500546 RepID=A0ABW1QTV6_9ACTN|nr:hypothetical protein [Nocardioides yefusunii]